MRDYRTHLIAVIVGKNVGTGQRLGKRDCRSGAVTAALPTVFDLLDAPVL